MFHSWYTRHYRVPGNSLILSVPSSTLYVIITGRKPYRHMDSTTPSRDLSSGGAERMKRHATCPGDAWAGSGPLGMSREGTPRPSGTEHTGDPCEGRARHATDDRRQVPGADHASLRGNPCLLYAHGGDQGAG